MKASKERVAQKIKRLLLYKKLTQKGLANKLSVDRQYISKLENGKVNLT